MEKKSLLKLLNLSSESKETKISTVGPEFASSKQITNKSIYLFLSSIIKQNPIQATWKWNMYTVVAHNQVSVMLQKTQAITAIWTEKRKTPFSVMNVF